jgi:cobalt-zinc-cadmium efflux system outer membrane protein
MSNVESRNSSPYFFSLGLALAVCGITAGCGATRHTVRTNQSEIPERVIPEQSQRPTPIEEDTSSEEIQEVAFFDNTSDAPPPVADEAVTSDWTIGKFEALAISNNPAIQQASAAAYKAMGFRHQVGLSPNPTVGYNGTQLADRGTDQHVAFVEQNFVTADKLNKNRIVLEQEVQSMLWEVQTQRQRVLTDIHRYFYKTLTAQRRLELAIQFKEVAEKGVHTAQARLDAKEGSRTDLLQSEIQLNQVEVQLSQAEATLRGSWKQLVALAGIPEATPQKLVGTLPSVPDAHDWQLVSSDILATSPELRSARSRLSRAQANIDRQESQATPNLQFMLAAGRDNGTGSSMINTQIGLPLPIHNANQGNISAAHSELCRASQDVRRTELAIQSRLAQAQNEYESAAAAVDRYREEILPRAEETLRLVEAAYAAGEFDFLQVLIARRTYFDSNLAFLTAQSDLAQAESLVNGLVLTGGLETTRDTEFDSALRDQALNGQ